jgi:hypothetical protein
VSDPIVFISHFSIKDGMLDAYKAYMRDQTPRLEADKPRTLVFLAYHSEDGTQLTIVHAFADAEAMDLHVEGAAERSKAAYEYLVPAGWEIYGTPSESVIATMRQAATAAGIPLSLHPAFTAGFLRAVDA